MDKSLTHIAIAQLRTDRSFLSGNSDLEYYAGRHKQPARASRLAINFIRYSVRFGVLHRSDRSLVESPLRPVSNVA